MTINVTLQTKKPGKLEVYKIEFEAKCFDLVINKVSAVKTIEELKSNPLWKVI